MQSHKEVLLPVMKIRKLQGFRFTKLQSSFYLQTDIFITNINYSKRVLAIAVMELEKFAKLDPPLDYFG